MALYLLFVLALIPVSVFLAGQGLALATRGRVRLAQWKDRRRDYDPRAIYVDAEGQRRLNDDWAIALILAVWVGLLLLTSPWVRSWFFE